MTKKKFVALVVTVIFAVGSLFAFYAYAADSVRYSYNPSNFTLTVSGSGKMTDFTESNYSSSRAWFEYADATKNVVINKGIEHIGSYSFAGFSELESVSLPDSVTSLGDMAFGANDKLREITLGSNVTEIGSYAFGFDSNMDNTSGFVAHCPQKSAAQRFCLENHIYFDSPLSADNTAVAHITESHEQALWSFVAPADGIITFSSSGSRDTYGLIYDADNYVYSTSYSEMKKSALAFNDDIGNDVNFKVSYHLSSGKRYYLSAKMRSGAETSGDIAVKAVFSCDSHTLRPTAFDGETAELSCRYCEYTKQAEFMDYCNKSFAPLDVNNDGIVNAKDYARLVHGKY